MDRFLARCGSWAGSNRGMAFSGRTFAQLRTMESAISPGRVLSNFEDSRFRNSASSRFSFSNSRLGSRGSQFESSAFGRRDQFRDSRYRFRDGGAGFGRESSFGGDDFSFVPDLLSLALGFGNLALRGPGLLGPGLLGPGLLGLGLNLLDSVFADFGGSGGSGSYGSYPASGEYRGPGGYGAIGGYGGTMGSASPYWGPGVISCPVENLTCFR